MKTILVFVFAFALSGCETLGPMFEGSFGMENPDGEKYECVDNLDKCVKRCEVVTKDGAKYFKDFKIPPEQCKKEQNI